MIGCLLGLFKVEVAERYAHLASDWLKESAVHISESIAADILPGCLGLTTEALGGERGRTTKADWGIVTLLFPARLGERPPWAA